MTDVEALAASQAEHDNQVAATAASYNATQDLILAHALEHGHETTMDRRIGPGEDGLWYPICTQRCNLTS